jgi:hypothetical protein
VSNPGDQVISAGDVSRRLRDLERQVQQMSTARRLEAASIGQGGLTVKGGQIVILDAAGKEAFWASTAGLNLAGILEVTGHIFAEGGGQIRYHDADGNLIVYIGNLNVGGVSGIAGHGLHVGRADGTNVVDASELGFAVYDGDDNRVVWVTDEGLHSPALPIPFGAIALDVTGTDWTTVAECYAWRTFEKASVDVRWTRTDTPSGQVRLREVFTDTVVATSGTLSTATYTNLQGNLPRENGDSLFLRVEARITSGTGTVHPVVVGGWTGDVY